MESTDCIKYLIIISVSVYPLVSSPTLHKESLGCTGSEDLSVGKSRLPFTVLAGQRGDRAESPSTQHITSHTGEAAQQI